MKICKSGRAKTSFDKMSWFQRASLRCNLSKFEHAECRYTECTSTIQASSPWTLDVSMFQEDHAACCMLITLTMLFLSDSRVFLRATCRRPGAQALHKFQLSECQHFCIFLHCIQMLLCGFRISSSAALFAPQSDIKDIHAIYDVLVQA